MSKAIFLVLFVFVSTACSHQQMYDAIQANNRMECDKYNNDENLRQKCIENASRSYDAYKRESCIDGKRQ